VILAWSKIRSAGSLLARPGVKEKIRHQISSFEGRDEQRKGRYTFASRSKEKKRSIFSSTTSVGDGKKEAAPGYFKEKKEKGDRIHIRRIEG